MVPLAPTWPIAHTYVPHTQDALLVGDTMRFSLELLEDIKATNQWNRTKLVRVARIERRENNEVYLWMEAADEHVKG